VSIQTALIIEDEETSRRIVYEILKLLGIPTILVAHDGLQARDILEQNPAVELVVCDIFMPARDGIEVINDLINMTFQGGLILMSSNALQFLQLGQLIARKNALNVWAALVKPVQLGDIAVAIEKGLSTKTVKDKS
jgi:CheY-like chemotaxis protein